jgi:hypothetical protein
MIVLQQPAEPRLAADRRCAYRRLVRRFPAATLPHWQIVIDSLIWSLVVVVLDELLDEIVQMPATETDEVVEAFLADGLDEALAERAGVGRAVCSLLDLQATLLHGVVEPMRAPSVGASRSTARGRGRPPQRATPRLPQPILGQRRRITHLAPPFSTAARRHVQPSSTKIPIVNFATCVIGCVSRSGTATRQKGDGPGESVEPIDPPLIRVMSIPIGRSVH